jgi:formamidase
VNGAKLSMGDMHFSQGDGEISFCGAIEMAGWLHLKINVIKQGVPSYAIRNPIFRTSHLEPHYSRFLTFEGISVTKEGEQKYLDASEAYRNACRNAIAYLKKFGWTGEQIYLMLSVIPCEGRIAGIVDVPNACATISIPLDVFTDTDLEPHLDAVVPRKDRGQVPIAKPL